MGRKKVLIIINDLGGGGAERVFVNLANGFAKAGVETEFLLGRKRGVYLDILKPGLPVHELKASNLFQYIRKLPAFLKNKDYNHIFTASDYISLAAILAKRRLKLDAKVIATLHYNLWFNLSTLPLLQRVWIKFFNRRYISKADQIVAVSYGVADGFRKTVKDENCHQLKVIYNPVFDNTIYEGGREAVAEDIFLNGRTTLISVGRLDENKNQKLLIDAFELLRVKNDHLQLIILGTGSSEKDIEKKIVSLNLRDKVRLLGFKQNPYAYISKSDLLVLSSLSEGLPTVIIEALALGVNVVSTNCPSGPDEILEHGKYGWLSVNNDAASLAANIEKALLNKHNAEFLQEKAQVFHKKNIISEYLELLD
jgi:glycosyltransferase involved in cell wall biosynthesis